MLHASEAHIELVVSYACPWQFLMSILCFSRTPRILCAVDSPIILWRKRKSSRALCFLGLCWKLVLSISRKRKQMDNISCPWDVTSSAITEKWGISSSILDRIHKSGQRQFWNVLLVYLAFLGPVLRCSSRHELLRASNLKIAIKFPSLWVGLLSKLILSCLCPCRAIP